MAEQRTLEAEQLYKSWQNEQPSRCSIPPWEQTSDAVRAEWEAIAAARRASPAMGEDSLPPLAEPTVLGSDGNIIFKGHTAEQVRQAQCDAVADRPTWADVQAREKDIRALQSEVIELRAQFARQSAPEGAPVCTACNGAGEYEHKGQDTRCRVCGGAGSTAGAGWKLVPVEPTPAMIAANGTCEIPEGAQMLEDDARTTWAAMLAAAPSNQSPAEEA